MKWCTFHADGRTRLGTEWDGRILDVTLASRNRAASLPPSVPQTGFGFLPADLGSLILLGPSAMEAALQAVEFARTLIAKQPQAAQGMVFEAEQITFLPPITRPGKILCAGVNYRSHFLEKPDANRPKEPFFFAKMASTMLGHRGAVPYPLGVTKLDYEVELAVVIGKRASKVTADRAMEHVFGYTLLNDLSARDFQFERNQLTLGKNFDGGCPNGPWVTPLADIPNPLDLRLTSKINGELRQDCRTSDMIFDVPTLIERVSATLTLEPGDILSTGTPAGVGMYRQPVSFLKSGDVIEMELEGVGMLVNTIR